MRTILGKTVGKILRFSKDGPPTPRLTTAVWCVIITTLAEPSTIVVKLIGYICYGKTQKAGPTAQKRQKKGD